LLGGGLTSNWFIHAFSHIRVLLRAFQTTTADLLRLSEWLAVNGCTHVAMEATGIYWKPVWHILDDGEFELVLANAAHVKNVPGRKTDVNDAMWLAELLAHGLIRASFVPNAQTQEMRNLLRTRKQLVREQFNSCFAAVAIRDVVDAGSRPAHRNRSRADPLRGRAHRRRLRQRPCNPIPDRRLWSCAATRWRSR
jgi:Transposase